MWNAFMLGREELQFNYLTVSLFPNVTEVANCNCLSFLRVMLSFGSCASLHSSCLTEVPVLRTWL